jgi:hypothetical protein
VGYPSLDDLRDALNADDADLELGSASDVDVMSYGPQYGGDVCPACGKPLEYDETVVRSDGDRGTVYGLADDDVTVPLFCPGCWDEVEATINGATHRTLDSFAEGA